MWEVVCLQLAPHTHSWPMAATVQQLLSLPDNACVTAQELQQQASSASAAREAAEADLARVKSKGGDIQRKACADAQPCVLLASIPNLLHMTFRRMLLPNHVTIGSNRGMPQ